MADDDLVSLRGDARFRDLVRRARDESSEGQARSRKAISRFERMSDDPPTSADPWYSVAKELLRAGEYDRAADAFRESAQRAIRPGASLYNAACALAMQGDDEAALVELERAVESGFDDPKLMRNDPDLVTLHEDGSLANNRRKVVHDFLAIRDRSSVLGSYSVDANGDTSIAPFVFSRVRAGRLTPFAFQTAG